MKSVSSVVVLALVASATGAAFACTAQDRTPSQVAVTFQNADLADPARVSDIHTKLLKAAQFVCESEGEGPKWREADDRACETEALQKAEQQLAAIHRTLAVASAQQAGNADRPQRARIVIASR